MHSHVSVDGFFAGPHGEIDWFKAIERPEVRPCLYASSGEIRWNAPVWPYDLRDDEKLVVVPLVLGAGESLKDVKDTGLKLLEAKSFKNGIAWLSYGSA